MRVALTLPVWHKVLARFVSLRGVMMLRLWLEAAKSSMLDEIKMLFTILTKLPINAKNVVDQAGIVSAVERFRECNEPSVEKKAATLLERWSKLKLAYVIGKAEATGEEKLIPRKWLKLFQTSALSELEGQFSVRMIFTKVNSNAESRALRITGTGEYNSTGTSPLCTPVPWERGVWTSLASILASNIGCS